MLFRFIPTFIIVMLASASIHAGDVVYMNGQVGWRPTQCKIPAEPAGLGNNPETPANDMNARVNAYNSYVQASQAYMNCLTDESQHDAKLVSHSVTEAALKMIDSEQQKVRALGQPLQARIAK